MIMRHLLEQELLENWQEEDPSARVRGAFPLVGVPGTEQLGVVYFEIEPGNILGTHTDSQDEIVVLLSGSGEGTVGEETGCLGTGGLVYIPAMVPHRFRNTGTETLRCVGIFAGANVVSTFEHALQPMGLSVLDHHALAAV